LGRIKTAGADSGSLVYPTVAYFKTGYSFWAVTGNKIDNMATYVVAIVVHVPTNNHVGIRMLRGSPWARLVINAPLLTNLFYFLDAGSKDICEGRGNH
jgi:hypothetical protein